MTKKRINMKYFRLPIILLVVIINLVCCRNEADDNPPVIDYIRITDPEKADSTFTKASAGSMIVVMGQNLGDVINVYINDQKIDFNPNFITDNSIIVSIPTEESGFELTAFNDNLTAQILVETHGGSATYDFLVTTSSPSLQRIAGVYPRNTGDNLKVYGKNLVDVFEVYFVKMDMAELDSNNIIANEDKIQVLDYSITSERHLDSISKKYVTNSIMSFSIPSGASNDQGNFNNGVLIIDCEAGSTKIEYATLPPKPTILKISDNMPIPGTSITIYGNNFVNVQEVRYANTVIPSEELKVADSEDQISFTFTSKPEASTLLTVKTIGGENSIPFYQYEMLLIDFDTRGHDLTWEPNATYQEANSSEPPYVSDGNYALFNLQDNGSTWWGTMVYWVKNEAQEPFNLPSYEIIPANTSTSNVYLAFECYNTEVFSGTCFIHYKLQSETLGDVAYENFSWETNKPYNVILPNSEGIPIYNQWYTVTIPLSNFAGLDSKTYEDIVDAKFKTLRIMELNYKESVQKLNLCIDNIRLLIK